MAPHSLPERLPALPDGDNASVMSASVVLSTRWELPEVIAAQALIDMASDLGVETDALSRLVLESHRWTLDPIVA